jgi:hypothetical protein
LFHFLCLNLMVSKISTIKQLRVFLMVHGVHKCLCPKGRAQVIKQAVYRTLSG